MATAGETVPDSAATADAAERLAKAAGEAADAAGEALGIEAEEKTANGDARNFWFRVLMTVVVVIVCYVATRVIRGESPEERRLRLRAERRAKKKAERTGPDEIDKLLASVVRRKPGQQIPPGATPIGPGMPRGMPAGAGQGAAANAAGAAARNAAVRGNGVARGPPPPGADHRPKLRWDQTNEEVELVIRVDPKVARSDVQVEITTSLLKLNLRGQTVISGHLFKTVDPEGSTWVIDDPGPGHPKEVTITLLKAEPATSREQWWRSPLKGLENRAPQDNNAAGRRSPPPQTDSEMVRKAIEAIRAKSGVGPGMKLGARSPAIQGAGQATNPSPNAGTAVATAAAGSSTAAANAPASAGEGAAGAVSGNAAAAAQPAAVKAGKTGGKKKNRKKK